MARAILRATLIGTLACSAATSAAGQSAQSAVADWAAARAVPIATVEPGSGFRDLAFLKPIVGTARVVGLGEGMHGSHDFLALRNRLFEFLVEEMGFTAIALETGFTESIAADDYVQGKGEITPDIMNAGFSWSANAFAENRQLLDWMRAYNARPGTTRKIHFYGHDFAGARLGKFPGARKAVDAALGYVTAVEPAEARTLEARLEPLLGRFHTDGYDSLPQDARDRLTAAIQDLVNLFERRHITWVQQTSALEYHRAQRNAMLARHLDSNFRAASTSNPRRVQIGRGAAMIDNLRWILEREGPAGRVLVYAHNTHMRKAPTETSSGSLGQRLHEILGTGLLTIGSLYYDGSIEVVGDSVYRLGPAEPATFNALLANAVKAPIFALDMRTIPQQKPVLDWLALGRPLRHGQFEGDPTHSFDVLIFVRQIRPVRVLLRKVNEGRD